MCCRFVPSSMFQCFTLEDIAVLGECCPSGRDSSVNHLLVMDFASGAVSLSQVDVALYVLDLSVVDIYWCVGFYHHLCHHRQTLIITCISSFLLQLLYLLWCISAYEYVVGEAKMIKIFAAYLQAYGFPNQSSEYAFECCRVQLDRYGISLLYTSPNVDFFL